MLSLLLENLDEIQGLEPNPETDEEVVELMEQVASTPGGLQLLVERYSSSQKPIFVRSLSFLLALAASSPTLEIWDLITLFITQLHCLSDESTLINSLTAIQRLLIFVEFPVSISSQFQSTFYSFLMHCLQQSVLVQRGAIAVLSRMYQDDLLTNIFEPVQLAALSNTVLQLSTIHDEMLDRELEGLSGFF